MARLLHPDQVTVLELVVRGDRIFAHEVSAHDPGLVTGCSSVPVTASSTDLLRLLVTCGYIAGKDVLDALDAIARALPPLVLSSGTRGVVELLHAIEAEAERLRREAAGEGAGDFDA